MRRLNVGREDVIVWPMPLFHTAGCVMGVLGAVSTCATLVLVTQFDPGVQLELIESYRATITGGVPTMLIALLRHPERETRDLTSLRLVVGGGAPVPVEVAVECERRFGAPCAVVFGTTECSCIVTSTRPDDPPEVRTATLGTALPHVEVMIADLMTGQPVPTDTVGELCARGPLVMHGYFDDPDGTTAAIDAEGWYHTGDLAAMDAGGCLRVEGRTKDMIIRGGENIYPREIEDLLHTHPAVAEVAVVGRPDPVWGETVAAFVRLAGDNSFGNDLLGDDAAADDVLADYCRAHLAAYKTPITWVFVDEFPVTASGKVRKNVLRERLVTG
jgi:fatty-acyl-CoA synthase